MSDIEVYGDNASESNETSKLAKIKETLVSSGKIKYIIYAVIAIVLVVLIYYAYRQFTANAKTDKTPEKEKPIMDFNLHETVRELELMQNKIIQRISTQF